MRPSSSRARGGSSSRPPFTPHGYTTPPSKGYTPFSSQGYTPPKVATYSEYFEKPKVWPILVLNKNDEAEKTPRDVANYYFDTSNGWYYPKTAMGNHRHYYEEILIQSESVFIEHVYTDSNKLSYSKMTILKLITPYEWGSDLSKERRLFKTGLPGCQVYNYFDYIKAWDKVFLCQNMKYGHTWWVQFDKNCNFEFPPWFHIWSVKLGPMEEILPLPVQKSFAIYKRKKLPGREHNPLLMFFMEFTIPWIIKWDFILQNSPPPVWSLCRKFYVRWWPKYNNPAIEPSEIETLLSKCNFDSPPSSKPTTSFTSIKEQVKLDIRAKFPDIPIDEFRVLVHKELMKRLNIDSDSDEEGTTVVISDSSMKETSDTEAGNPEDLDYTTPPHLLNEDDCYGFETQFNN